MEYKVLGITTEIYSLYFYTLKKHTLELTRITEKEETEVYVVTGRAKPKQCKTLVLKHLY